MNGWVRVPDFLYKFYELIASSTFYWPNGRLSILPARSRLNSSNLHSISQRPYSAGFRLKAEQSHILRRKNNFYEIKNHPNHSNVFKASPSLYLLNTQLDNSWPASLHSIGWSPYAVIYLIPENEIPRVDVSENHLNWCFGRHNLIYNRFTKAKSLLTLLSINPKRWY